MGTTVDEQDACNDGVGSSDLIPGNFQLNAKTITLPSYQNYRNGCMSIDGSLDNDENVFFLQDPDRNIIVQEYPVPVPISIDLDDGDFDMLIQNSKFSDVITQGFDAMKGFQEAYDYYLDKFDVIGYDNNPNTQLKAIINTPNNTEWSVTSSYWVFEGGNSDYTASVNPKTIYHEYTHAILERYIGL